MMIRTVALLLSGAVSVAFSTAAFPAPAPAAATSPNDDNSIQEIVVTAEKRTESLETVPVAISAFTSKQRDLIGIETIQDMTNYAPGLAYSTALDRAFIRGIGRETNQLGTQPGVATYADGLYNTSVVAASGDSLFIDRVEILRGPQGTLYGRNSIGGTIDSISKRPTADWEAEVRVNVANYGVHNFEGSLSGPISDTMRFRFAGYHNTQEDGYYTNLANGKTEGGNGNFFYVEGQFEWDITPDVEFWLKFDQLGYNQSYRFTNYIGSYDEAPYGPASLIPNPGFGYTTTGFNNLGTQTQNPGNQDLHNFSQVNPTNAKLSRTYSVTPQLTWHTPWNADLKYVGGYTTYYYDLWQAYDGGIVQPTSMLSYNFPVLPPPFAAPGTPPLTVYPTVDLNYIENKKYFSNELNLTSHSDSALQWIVGLYQYHEQWDQPQNLIAAAQGQAPCARGFGCLQTPFNLTVTGLAAPNPQNYVNANDANMKGNSYAIFGQTDWKFFPTWKLTTGLRYTYDKLDGTEDFRRLCLGLPACLGITPAQAAAGITGPGLFGAFTPTNDITSTAPGIAACATPAGCAYRGVTMIPTLIPSNGFYARGLGDSWGAVTGTMGLEWTPNDTTLGYLKYTRGYKSGGFNEGASMVANPESEPEHINAYEIGGKEVFNKQIQINTAFFYYDYQNLQIPLAVQPNIGPTFTSVVNIPRVGSFGAEFETIWQPIANLQFLVDYSYMQATIRSNFTAQNSVSGAFTDVIGQTVPQSPRHKVAVNGNYTWHFTPGSLNFSASYIWKAATYDAIFNEPYFLAPAYSEVDSRLTWTDASDRYTVFIFGKNLQNKIGYSNVTAAAITQPAPGFPNYDTTYELTPPRTYGIEFQYRWK